MTDETGSAGADNPGGAAALLGTEGEAQTGAEALAGKDGEGQEAGRERTDWIVGLPEELRPLAQNKGWKSATDAIQSYTALEKLVGTEKIPMPKDENDKEGLERVYKALGRPDTPEGYKLPVPEGADPAFAATASTWFHEAGLSAKQAAAVTEKWNGHMAAAAEAEAKAFKTRSEQDIGALRTEWGDRYDANLEMGRKAARQFGLDKPALAGIEQTLGTKRMMQFLHKIGQGLGEHGFEAGDTKGGGFTMTPEAARARLSALKADPGWAKRYLNGDADARAEMTRLQQVSAAG